MYAEGYIVFRISVRMFVRLFVTPSRTWNLQQSFACKFLKWGISHEPLIRKHSYLDHRYPGGSAFIPWLLTPGSLPQGGARGQNLGHLKKVFFYFSVMETIFADSWSDMARSCDIDLWIMKWRTVWPIFHGPVILLISIWCMNIILWDYESVWPEVWPKNKCRSLWPIFYGPVILPCILKTIWCMNIMFWIMNQFYATFGLKIMVCHWPIFHGPVILCYILKTIWYMNSILQDYASVWPDIWP